MPQETQQSMEQIREMIAFLKTVAEKLNTQYYPIQLMGRKAIQKAMDIGPVEASHLINSGLLPTLQWGKVKKVKADDFNNLINQSIEEGTDLLALIRSHHAQKKSGREIHSGG